jgi:transposase InsO family protein
MVSYPFPSAVTEALVESSTKRLRRLYLISTPKDDTSEERVWLREWDSPLELEKALAAWIEWYNTQYLHSALGYRTPCQVE